MDSSIFNRTTCEDEEDLMTAIQNYYLNIEELQIAGWPEEVVEIWPLARQLTLIANDIAFYFTLPFSIFGVILTCVSMNALRNSKYRNLTIYFYLKALSITDMVALFCRCGIEPIRGLSLKFNNFFIDHWWMCYLYGLAANSVTLISAWIVVLITVMRLVAVARPFSLYRPNSPENINQAMNYIYILILLCFISTLFTCYFSLVFEINSFNYIQCDYTPKSWNHARITFTIYMALCTWVPATITILGNGLIWLWIKINQRRIGQIRNQSSSYSKAHPLGLLSLVCAFLMLPYGVCTFFALILAIYAPETSLKGQIKNPHWTKFRILILSFQILTNNFYLWRFSLHLPVFALFGSSHLRGAILENLKNTKTNLQNYLRKNVKKSEER